METPLPVKSMRDMAFLARKVAEGERSPEEFFKHWPDISSENEHDIRDLWFHVQYFENDIVHDPASAEYWREAILETAGRIEERYRVKWDPLERGEQDAAEQRP
jgi:hypothetical protein